MIGRVAEGAISRGRLIGFLILLIIFIGLFTFTRLGQLEDPEFTVRTALVMTEYPGADATRVEQEVTEILEKHIQQLGELDELESFSRDGTSVIYVHVDDRYGGQRLRQIWDELQKKVARATHELPDSIRGPLVDDDYGDVYSTLLSVTGDGYSYAELSDITDHVRQRLLRVDDVAKVDIFGDQGERVFIETSRAKIAELGLTPALVVDALNQQNIVAPGGFVEAGPRELRMYTSGVIESVEQLADLAIRSPMTGEMVRLRDFAEVQRGYADPPEAKLRFDGDSALALGVVPTEGANVVELSERLEQRLSEIERQLPVGVEFGAIALQADEVERAVGEFLLNLAMAVAIVLLVLMIFLGPRTGIIVGVGVPLTILATFIAMYLMDIDLHRVSLGALVIVLGMLVDNAIVISELTQVKMQQGVARLKASVEAVKETAWPLLAATAIAVLAFAPIVLSDTTTGEFTESLFWVVAVSLVISWFLAITFTPLMTHHFLKEPDSTGDPLERPIYQRIQRIIHRLVDHPRTVVGSVIGVFIISLIGFSFVPQTFFPPAQRAQFMVDYWLPEGTRIEETARDMERIEQHLLSRDDVEGVTAFIGEGAPRFYLPMIPETPNPAFGQILVNLDEDADLEHAMGETRAWLSGDFPEAEPRVKPMQLGEPVRFPLQMRLSGGDRERLLELTEEVQSRIAEHPGVTNLRHDWRQQRPRIDVDVDQDRARRANVTSAAVNRALSTAFAGQAIDVFREDDQQIPIVWRFPLPERTDPSRIETMVIWPEDGGRPVPLGQVADVRLDWGHSVIWRHDRERSVSLQADLRPGYTVHDVQNQLTNWLDDVELPPGYQMEWDGEVKQAAEARAGVMEPVPVILGLMVLVLMAQFNSYRRMLLVMLTVPLGIVGVSIGLLLFQQPFGFMALLGTMSLSGMIIRNAVVMIEKMDLELRTAEGDPVDTVVRAATSRFRPIMLTAATTLLGMLPLALSGPFWAPMALSIMFGLAFASVLAVIVIPVAYVALLRLGR